MSDSSAEEGRPDPSPHSRSVLRSLLAEGALEAVAARAVERHRVLGQLIALTYDADPLLSWRAVRALGLAAEGIAEAGEPRVARETVRRLHWLMTEESGGICWRAPEAMAEIVARRPSELRDYIPIILHFLTELADEDLRHFRPSVLRAIARLGPLAAPAAGDIMPALLAAAKYPDSKVRGPAVLALLALGRADAVAANPALLHDPGTFDIYEAGRIQRVSVADVIAGYMAVTET